MDDLISEMHQYVPIEPALQNGIWLFEGGSGWELARSVVEWLRSHPDVEVRAVVPVIQGGASDQMLVLVK